MAFLLLVKNRENLPKLVNLFVHHDITHIVLEYFKFKPFIVPRPNADLLQHLHHRGGQALRLRTPHRTQKPQGPRHLPPRHQARQLPLQPRHQTRHDHRFWTSRNRPQVPGTALAEIGEDEGGEEGRGLARVKRQNLQEALRMPEDNRAQQDRNRDIHAAVVDPAPLAAIVPVGHLAGGGDPAAIRDKKVQHLQQRAHDQQAQQRQELLLHQLHRRTRQLLRLPGSHRPVQKSGLLTQITQRYRKLQV